MLEGLLEKSGHCKRWDYLPGTSLYIGLTLSVSDYNIAQLSENFKSTSCSNYTTQNGAKQRFGLLPPVFP